jgi:hypothetical protein
MSSSRPGARRGTRSIAALDRAIELWPLIRGGRLECGGQTRQHETLLTPHSSLLTENIMSLKCGIVGLPNVGKSTLFNALTKAGIAAENYPFCTIEPNVGIVEVPDPRMKQTGRDR